MVGHESQSVSLGVQDFKQQANAFRNHAREDPEDLGTKIERATFPSSLTIFSCQVA
jgi:hypothetical protein